MAKALTDDGVLLLEEGLGSAALPYASGVNPSQKRVAIEVRMWLDGPVKLPEVEGCLEPSSRPTASHSRSATWGSDPVPVEAHLLGPAASRRAPPHAVSRTRAWRERGATPPLPGRGAEDPYLQAPPETVAPPPVPSF